MNRLKRTFATAVVVVFAATLPSGCGDPCDNAESAREKAAEARNKRDQKTDPDDVYNLDQVAKKFDADADAAQAECNAKGS